MLKLLGLLKSLIPMASHKSYGFTLRSIRYVRYLILQSTFEFWQRLGIHVTLMHYYRPIPDTRELRQRKGLWENKSELVGIEMNESDQLIFARKVFPSFKEEYEFPRRETRVPYEFYLDNPQFGPVDAEVAYSMVRHFLPKKIIEIGSGYSTYLMAKACLLNKERSGVETELHAIDPYPRGTLVQGFPGLSSFTQEKAENIELSFYSQLDKGDILFIDTTHIVTTGGEVNCLFLEVLPRLRSGVIVHIHDIFLPREYPRDWVLRMRRFYTEQYLLQAFLVYNQSFKVLWCASYMHFHYPQELEAVFPNYNHQLCWPSSFWMQKEV